MYDDYRYCDEARERNFMLLWKCNKCGHEREDQPGINEGGKCGYCDGMYEIAGESYDS